MEKELSDKLERMDLQQVEGLQWDQDRAWARLNGQLKATPIRRVLAWHYAAAAAVVLLLVAMAAYLGNRNFLNNDIESDANQIALLDEQKEVKVNEQPTEKKPAPQVVEKVLPIQQKRKNAYKQQPVVTINDLAPIKEEIDEVVQKAETEMLEIEEVSEAQVIEEEPVASVENKTIHAVLASTPVTAKKSKFSIKLFNKKRKTNDSKSVPALTLFASK